MRFICLAVICIAVSLCSAAGFQRPWENATWLAQNPNIYASAVWWNIPELDRTMDSLDAESAAALELSGPAKSHAEAAVEGKRATKNALWACLTNISSFWPELAKGLVSPFWPALDILGNFTRVPSCTSYGGLWKGTADDALMSMEGSIAAADASVENARVAYARLRFLGLCNRNYTRAGSEPCAEMQSAFAAVDANATEGAYGKYAAGRGHAAAAQAALLMPVPSLAHYGPLMAVIWGEGGVVPSFSALSMRAGKAETDAEAEYESLLAAARARKQMAGEGLAAAKAQRLDLITRAPAAYEAREAGSVAERLAELERQATRLSNALREAELLHSSTLADSHLANSVSMAAAAGSGYAAVIRDSSALQEDAREAVAQQKEEAEAELADTEAFMAAARSARSAALYSEAKSLLAKAEAAATPGAKFSAYSQAAAAARGARSGWSYEEELESKAALAQLRSLIAAAKADGINTATEEAGLALLERQEESGVSGAADALVAGIINKARLRYDDGLLATRGRLLDKLALAGEGAADLYTDLYRSEAGAVGKDGSITYPDAVGKLKALEEDYAGLEATLDAYMGEIVGNAMSVSASPLVEGARPDEPATIILDAVLANGRNYAARNVTARVRMPSPLDFVYSDITSGRETVASMRMADGGRTVLLVFDSVKPFEARHIILQKQAVVAHTLKKEEHAEGSGGGQAAVSTRLEFMLDTAVKSMALPFGNALIDGSAPKPLGPGRHVAAADYVVADAYDERRSDFRAYSIGTNSRMEYDIEITPHMDLDSVLVMVDSANGSRVSSLEVVAATGELVKDRRQVSQSEYAAKVMGLKNGRTAVLKVSYLVEDTGAYVRSQIALLETYQLSAESRRYLDEARSQLAAGNSTSALELLEKSRGASRDGNAENAKLEKKCDELSRKLAAELEELGAALSSNAAGPFMARLSARKAELERVRAEAEGLGPAEKAAILGKVDYGWMEKELGALRKDSYKEYNLLKGRFFAAGNSTTPPEFLAFESALNRLETGGRLEYAVQAVQSLQAVRSLVEAQESAADAANELLRSEFGRLKAEVLEVQERYLREAGMAKGTEYAGFFTETSQTIARKIKEAEDSLRGDSRITEIKVAELNKTKVKMLGALGGLKSEAEAKLALVESIMARADIDAAKRADLESKLQVMKGMLAAGEYVNALRAGTAISKELESAAKKDGNGLLLLGITALAVLAVVAAYMIKQQDGRGCKKPLRKLQKAGEPPDEQAPG